MHEDWLKRALTVAQAEAENLVTNEHLGSEPIPFGYCSSQWRDLLARMQPGDEIWEFSSPPETWEDLCGRRGIVLLRGKEAVAWIVTSMN